MARSRVPAESRRRSQRACDFCRMSKKRCDGVLPCYNCARRGREASCAYNRHAGEQRGREPPSAATATVDVEPGGRTAATANSPYPTPGTDASERGPPSCTQHMHPRMLLNGAAGEKGADQLTLSPLFPLASSADSIGLTDHSLHRQLGGPVVPAISEGYPKAICRVLCFHRKPD